ncbi:MAG: aspartate dehydrogenase domain-containing protein [Candidatus Heimdallarchaeaceae archaeon]
MKKIGVIGLGYIGTTIIEAVADETIEDAIIQAVYDIDEERMKEVHNEFPEFRLMENQTDFDDCDVVIECAIQEVVAQIFDSIVKEEKYFVPMSIGAFITIDPLYSKYQTLDKIMKKRILLSSGAIGGFDCIETIKSERIKSAKLKTRKPNIVFRNSSYIEENEIKLNDDTSTTIFTGNAKQAATHFPKSVNVAARLALSTLGPENTMVEIIADPTVSQNIHTIEIESDVGKYTFNFENNPSQTNPKTSWLAALSAINTVNKI